MLQCGYCGGSSTLGGAAASPPAPSPGVDAAMASRVIEAFKAAAAAGLGPFEALVVASRERLGPMGETDTFARVVFALATDFDAQHGTTIVREPMALARIIEGYFKSIEGLRAGRTYELNLPFLTATSEGPVHLVRTLSAADVAALLAPRPAPKKKGWWPFG